MCTCHQNPLNCDKTDWKCNNCGHNLKADCAAKIKADEEAYETRQKAEAEKFKAVGSTYVKVEKT